MRTIWVRLVIDRWIAKVAPLAARCSRFSRSGIGEERVVVRVRITVCEIPGRVSSRSSAAAAAAKDGTPGVMSYEMPSALSRRICSPVAP